MPIPLARMTTSELAAALAAALATGKRAVVLLPVGSVEPHGPHLPLDTDTVISQAASTRAGVLLEGEGLLVFVAPSVPYGVTNFAEGFAGAVSVSSAALTAFVQAVVDAYLAGGFVHVCVVNNHLEPEHDAAVRAAVAGFPPGLASVACPLTKRWARTLSDEFKSGACHAGEYETSLVLAADPGAVRREAAAALPALTVSFSEGPGADKTTFRAMGMLEAYTGAPALATAEGGERMLERLATMIVTEVKEALDR
jgi:creatinine amidohydrolase